MAKFKIEWHGGEVEIVNQSDCATISQFIACRFGDALPAAKVSFADEVVVEAEEVVVKPKAKKKVAAE